MVEGSIQQRRKRIVAIEMLWHETALDGVARDGATESPLIYYVYLTHYSHASKAKRDAHASKRALWRAA